MAYDYNQALFVKPYLDRTLTRTSIAGALPTASTELLADYAFGADWAEVVVCPNGRLWVTIELDVYFLEPDLTILAQFEGATLPGRRLFATADGHLVMESISNNILQTFVYDVSTGTIINRTIDWNLGVTGFNAAFSVAAGPATSDVWVLTANSFSGSSYGYLRIRAFDPVTGAVTFDGPDIAHGISSAVGSYGKMDNDQQKVTLGWRGGANVPVLHTVSFSGEVVRVDTAPAGYRSLIQISGHCDEFYVLDNDGSGAADFDLWVLDTRTGGSYETSFPAPATATAEGKGFIVEGVLVALFNDNGNTLLYSLDLATNAITLLSTMTGEIHRLVKAGGGLALPWLNANGNRIGNRVFSLAGELDPNDFGWYPSGTTGGVPNSDLSLNLVAPMPSAFVGPSDPAFWTAFIQTREVV
jgi:hypothetical protein